VLHRSEEDTVFAPEVFLLKKAMAESKYYPHFTAGEMNSDRLNLLFNKDLGLCLTFMGLLQGFKLNTNLSALLDHNQNHKISLQQIQGLKCESLSPSPML